MSNCDPAKPGAQSMVTRCTNLFLSVYVDYLGLYGYFLDCHQLEELSNFSDPEPCVVVSCFNTISAKWNLISGAGCI